MCKLIWPWLHIFELDIYLQIVGPTTYPSATLAATSVVEVQTALDVRGVTTRTTPGVWWRMST